LKIEDDHYIAGHITPEEFKKSTGVIIAKYIYILGFPRDIEKLKEFLSDR